MTILYCSSGNVLKVVEVDDITGNLVRIVQTIEPIIDPLPEVVPKSGFMSPVTEWVEKHPLYDLIYVFTSFWSYHSAMVSTFRIVDPISGALEKLGEAVETGGLHAAHVAFSPDRSTLCVGHHNDGNVCFFDCSCGDRALGAPIMIVQTPEVNRETRTTQFPKCLPSIHHVHYSPNGKYLLTSDSSRQGRVWTYHVDCRGLPTSETPASFHRVTYVRKPPGWLTSVVTSLMDANVRIRRAVVHPDGNFVYLLMEFNAVVQVYEIDEQGKIYGDCLQEVETISNQHFSAVSSRATELIATPTEVFVSNRGWQNFMGSAESGIRIFTVKNQGAQLVQQQSLTTAGPICHFWMDKGATKLYSGVSTTKPQLIESFVRKQISNDVHGEFEKVGEADVGMDVLCIASKDGDLAVQPK